MFKDEELRIQPLLGVEKKETASSQDFRALFNMVCAMAGAGILGLPAAVQQVWENKNTIIFSFLCC
jgi:amino acid permease